MGDKMIKTLDAHINRIAEQMNTVEETASAAIDLLNLQKEKVLIAFHRLANAVNIEKVRCIMQAKEYVLNVMREYNRYAKKYTQCIGIDLAKFDTSLPEYILRTGTVPEIPRFAYCIELFETVGDETRLVGEHKEDENDNGYAFIFGNGNNAPAQVGAPKGAPGRPSPASPDGARGGLTPVSMDPSAAGSPNNSGKGNRKYMAADDSDTVYLTIPFDGGSDFKGKKARSKKKNDAAYMPDPDITILTSDAETPISIGGATISVVTEKQPKPTTVSTKKGGKGSKAQAPAPTPEVPAITPDTINTLAQALSDAAKIVEYAKAAEQYAHSAERAARRIEDADKVVSNDGIFDRTSIPQPLVMESSTRSNYETVKRISKSQLRGFILNTETKLANARRECTKADTIKDAARPDAKPRLTVACMAPTKAVIDALSDMLAAYSNMLDTDGVSKTKKELLAAINKYNSLVADYEKLTGGKLTAASLDMVDDIIAGRPYSSLPEVKFIGKDRDLKDRMKSTLAITESSVPTPERDRTIMNREQLHAYLNRCDRDLMKYRRAYASAERRIASSRDQDRAIAIVDALIARRDAINLLCENLVAACQVSAFAETGKIKKMIGVQIKEYNALVKELENTSGDQLTPASEDLPQEIISGISYRPLPEIKYDIVNPKPETIDRINKAIADGKEFYKDEIEKEGHLSLGSVSAKIAAQANKDVGVVVNCAAFEISVLESERDILRYGYGGELARFGNQRKLIAKKIAHIKRNHAKAIKCAEADNERYYQVVMNNPATVDTKRPNPNRKKLAELRTRMIALLNERDRLNSKLTAIYTGSEYNLDGTGINQTWRRIKADAIEKQVKRDKFVAREIKNLPASDSEKARIYELMNKRLDAISTNALCKYRLRKEYLQEGEWNKVVKDMKESRRLKKRLDDEITVLVKRIYKRYKESGIASAWITGMGFFLLFALVCVVAYVLLFNSDIIDSIRTVKSLFGF